MNTSYVNYLNAVRKSQNTVDKYTKYVGEMLKFVNKPETEITYNDLLAWQSSISKLSANTVCLELAAVKSYFKYLAKSKIISENPAKELERPKKNPKEKPYINAEDARTLVNACRTLRDKAIILTFCNTGLRITELVNLTLAGFEKIKAAGEITLIAKGQKERLVCFNDETINAVEDYLETRHDDCPYLFASFRRTQLDGECFSKTIKATAKRAGLPYWEDMTNHSLRSACAVIHAEAGIPVENIRDMLGHSNIATTSLYLKTSKDNVRKVMTTSVF